MQHEGLAPVFEVGVLTLATHMAAKCVLVPLVMLWLALALGLDDEAGRMAVLLASLPVTMASYSLTSHYGLDRALLGANVIMGMLLLLPTVLGWLIALDLMQVFPATC
jgi:predicted permease